MHPLVHCQMKFVLARRVMVQLILKSVTRTGTSYLRFIQMSDRSTITTNMETIRGMAKYPFRNLIWQIGSVGSIVRTLLEFFSVRIQSIPSEQKLWRAVYKKEQLKRNGKPTAAFFRDRNGLSCDLAIFTTTERSRRGIKRPPWPEGTGLVEFSVALVRDPPIESDVRHHPLKKSKSQRKNYAHCRLSTHLDADQGRHLAETSKIIVVPDL